MIFDRTISDVRKAEDIRRNKVQKRATLTDADITALERGTLSLDTLNRVELKQAELAQTLTKMGYPVACVNHAWADTNIFDEAEFLRICDNNANLRRAFFVFKNTPADAVPMYRYDQINALEHILYDLEQMITFTKLHYRRCGNYRCGEG